MNGPYEIRRGDLCYVGNKVFAAGAPLRAEDYETSSRHRQIKEQAPYWDAVMCIDAHVGRLLHAFFRDVTNALLVDLPLLTRSISSPGALGPRPTIVSDVKPFELKYFDRPESMFLSQSSQLYLEAYVLLTRAHAVYTIGKSFRNEVSDFRHLVEFRHAEYESLGGLDEVIDTQQKMLKYVIDGVVKSCGPEMRVLLDDAAIDALGKWDGSCDRLTFEEAIRLLHRSTGDDRFGGSNVSATLFDARAEILLTSVLGGSRPVFVTHYPETEVAFYHEPDEVRKRTVRNADLLFPGYGEICGSGERVRTRDEVARKMRMFGLASADYDWYGEIREISEKTHGPHSGFGLGIERLLAAMLRLPSVHSAVPFPRASWSVRP